MMMDQWTNRLSDYLDDELGAAERKALEAHLATCAACGRTLDELRRVVAHAGALEDRPPAKDLWAGVARRIGVTVPAPVIEIGERRRARRFAFTIPQLAAAAIITVFASAGGVWMVGKAFGPTDGGGATATIPPDRRLPEFNIAWADSTERVFDASVAELRQVLEQGRDRLDTTTVRVLEENLRIVDQAIAQARAALAADPGSAYLSSHLVHTMRTKLELLRRVQAIAVRS